MDPGAVFLLQVFIWLLSGTIVGYLGSQRGRHPVGWFLIGMAAPCIGLILVLVLPDLKKQADEEKQKRRENRRLREQLAQERSKNQAFRGHVTHRLDSHDEKLGIDTRSTAPSQQLPPPPPAAVDDGLPTGGWYLVQPGEEAEGPFGLDVMRDLLAQEVISARTLVWHESMDEWLPLDESPLGALL